MHVFLFVLPKKTTKIIYYFVKSDNVRCPVYAAVWLCSQDQLLVQAVLLLALALNCLWSNDTFFTAKKALKLIFCFCFISDYFKKSDSVHCCLAVQSRSIAFASLIVACIGFELLVIKRSFFPCSRKKNKAWKLIFCFFFFSDFKGCGLADPSVQVQSGSRRGEEIVFVRYDPVVQQ